MHACKAPANDVVGDADDIAVDLHPLIRTYKDGRVERLVRKTFVQASEDPGATGVATRDVVIDRDTGVSARLFLPSGVAASNGRLPLIVYFHGGGFCTESPFSRTYHRYVTSLAARSGALVVSVDYRLAPEHPVPAAHEDAWAALRWAASLADPWLAKHPDSTRMFVAGDSAGANLAHHVAVRAARDGNGIDIEGLVLVQPYFWGVERMDCEKDRHDGPVFSPEWVDKLWPFVTAGAAGNDDTRLDPPPAEISSLACRRALVAVAEKDVARDRGRRYAFRMRTCCRGGEVTLVESKDEDHGFHLYRSGRATAVQLMQHMVDFVNKRAASAPTELQEFSASGLCHSLEAAQTPSDVLSLAISNSPLAAQVAKNLPVLACTGAGRPDWPVLGNGSLRKVSGPSLTARNALTVGLIRPQPRNFGLRMGPEKPNKAHLGPFVGPPALKRTVASSCL